MKTKTLFQLGGIAVLLSVILTGIGNLIYFLYTPTSHKTSSGTCRATTRSRVTTMASKNTLN